MAVRGSNSIQLREFYEFVLLVNVNVCDVVRYGLFDVDW